MTKPTGGKIPANLTGAKFGMLTVERLAGVTDKRERVWLCTCECGNLRNVRGYLLKRGQAISCGCVKDERPRTANKTLPEPEAAPTDRVTTWKFTYDRSTGGRDIPISLPRVRFLERDIPE